MKLARRAKEVLEKRELMRAEAQEESLNAFPNEYVIGQARGGATTMGALKDELRKKNNGSLSLGSVRTSDPALARKLESKAVDGKVSLDKLTPGELLAL